MKFDSSFYKEELRWDFLVTAKHKKIWAVELQILEEFDRVCKKHHLTWFADYGTLLGAVRHQGFIPWDDDIDVSMFRDDYAKLLTIASEEFKEPFFFQTAYNDALILTFSKLRDSRTSAIQFPDMKDLNQGISIDIFPIDDVPCNNDTTLLKIQREIWFTIIRPKEMLQKLKEHLQKLNDTESPFVLNPDIILDLLKMDTRQRMKEFEAFNFAHFGKSENVNFLLDEMFNISPSKKRAYYNDIIYLPFENIEIPSPREYDTILTLEYGDWRKPVQGKSAHDFIILEPDIPYTEYI